MTAADDPTASQPAMDELAGSLKRRLNDDMLISVGAKVGSDAAIEVVALKSAS